MSQENIEIVRKGFDALQAFNRGELSSEATSDLLDPEIEFHWHDERAFPDQPQHLQGLRALVGHAEQMRSAWADLVEEPLEFIEASPDCVVTPIRLSGRGRESGVPVEIHFFYVFTIRDGRLRKIEFFRHRAEALEAVGLSE
jgi:ketosteroid isomerase-like protein